MDLKTQLFLLLIFLTIKIQSQEIEILHYTSSDQTYQTTCTNGDESLFIYLHFYGPGIIDYETLPYFFTTGWYELGTTGEKKNLIGIYHPMKSLVLFVPENPQPNFIDNTDDNNGVNIDTTKYLERFYFPLNKKSKKAIWHHGKEQKEIENIDFDEKNIYHKIFLKGGDLNRYTNRSIDITDFVIAPFGGNNIFLEDFNIEISSTYRDRLDHLHVLLSITNEYVIPSSLSSGGYCSFMIDENQIIRKVDYVETYNQGKYISYIDDDFIHETKKRYLILADWSHGQIIGSFFIENASIEIEKEWNLQ
jgi:hypothetical protein